MRLSNRGWNNVLIFSTLFMILLFNITHQKFVAGDDEESRVLVPAEAVLQLVDYSGVKFERIGANWRVQTSVELSGDMDVDSFVEAWQQQPFTPTPEPQGLDSETYSLAVLIQAIGLPSQLLFVFYISPNSDRVYIQNKVDNVWLEGSFEQAQLLIPQTLLKKD